MSNCSLIFEVKTVTKADKQAEIPRLLSASSGLYTVLSYSTGDLIGRPVDLIIFDAISLESFLKAVGEARSGSTGTKERQVDFKTSRGEKYSLGLSVSTMYRADGSDSIICIARDTAVLESAKRALLESEERFGQVASMTGEWLWEQDASGRYIYSSAAVENILGLQPEQVLGKRYMDLFANCPRSEFIPELYEPGKITTPFFHLLNYYRHLDGSQVVCESSGVPIIDPNGKLIKWRGVDRDVTARRRAEEENRKAQVKLAIANNEMKIARKIQESLLPSVPLIMPGLRVQGYCLPATQVGGDYFDYFCRDSSTVDVVIADVSGHAVGPALFMVETRSALRTQAQMTSEPDETLFMMNRFLYEDLSQSDHFITMFYLQYSGDIGQLSYANAGHNLPLLLRDGATSCVQLDADGLVLGVQDLVCFERQNICLGPRDRVFLYTDGLTEAQNPDGEFFGIERLCSLISGNAALSADDLIALCILELKKFRNKESFEDDLTMVILDVTDDR